MGPEGFQPPPPPPPAELPPAAPSSGLRLLGIAQCALGVFGLGAAPLTRITRFMARDPGSRKVQELLWEGWLGAWTYASLAIGTVIAFVLIAAGIGVVRGLPWGRTLTLVHGAVATAQVIVGQVVFTVSPFLIGLTGDSPPSSQQIASGSGTWGGFLAISRTSPPPTSSSRAASPSPTPTGAPAAPG